MRPMQTSWHPLVLVSLVLLAGSARSQGSNDPWTPEEDYRDTLFITPNGEVCLAGPMLYTMLGAGDMTYMHSTDPLLSGGGQLTKVGLRAQIFYTRETEGPDPDPDLHMRYYVNRGKEGSTWPLPPDVTSVTQLPDLVRFGPDLTPDTEDDLADFAQQNLARFPRVIAGLEWARYLNMPISFQLQTTVSHGGIANSDIDLDWYTESQGPDQCMWDASDICTPHPSNDPSIFVESGSTASTFSYATPTLADPALAATMGYDLPYRGLVNRNLADAISQLLALCSLPRYSGRLVAIAVDPEVAMPAHLNDELPLSHQLPTNTGGQAWRPFFEDYHPVMVRQFGLYLKNRYGDSAPATDSNGDGITFWGDFEDDYKASRGFGHLLECPVGVPCSPATWAEVDPPRRYPETHTEARSGYWQEWCNFLVGVVDGYLEDLVDTAVTAGLPPTRIFTHQTLAQCSYEANRVIPNPENRQTLADWVHLETSKGYIGISQYGATGVEGISGGHDEDFAYYRNLQRRDDSWGGPEFNPWIKQAIPYAPVHHTLAEMQNVVGKAWDAGAHVLWMHYWGAPDRAAVDVYSEYWTYPPSQLPLGVVPTLSRPDATGLWTAQGLTVHPTTSSYFILNSPDDYMETTSVSFDAATYPCVGVDSNVFSGPNAATGSSYDMRIGFFDGSTWHVVSAPGRMRYDCHGTQVFGIDLSKHPSYMGTITGLRYYPAAHTGAYGKVEEFTLYAQNEFTQATQELLVSKKDTPRPSPPTALVLPNIVRLDNVIPSAHLDGRLVVYGNDPEDPPENTDFTDFGYLENFYPKANVECGGVAMDAIVAPASFLIGQRKTGKYRRLVLPSGAVRLDFSIGIVGDDSIDGVTFRVLLRDHETRELVELFHEEHRTDEWKARSVSLAPWAGRLVDLLFETHAISDPTGDESAWGEPTIRVGG